MPFFVAQPQCNGSRIVWRAVTYSMCFLCRLLERKTICLPSKLQHRIIDTEYSRVLSQHDRQGLVRRDCTRYRGKRLHLCYHKPSLTRLFQAASGIGKETAIAFAEAGVKGMVFADISEEGALAPYVRPGSVHQ